jgi:ribose-phosphate pyrophosphokinase
MAVLPIVTGASTPILRSKTKKVPKVTKELARFIDDMIDTGSSLIPARSAVLKAGANSQIYAAVTHPILSGPALERLKKAKFTEVVVTDTIPLPKGTSGIKFKVLPIAPMLAQIIRHVESGESVTGIYSK